MKRIQEIAITRDGKETTTQLIGDVLGCDYLIAQLDDSDLRELVAYIKEKKPEILRDIMCDDCPEVC